MSIQYDVMQKQAEEKARRLAEAQQKLAMKSQVVSPNKGIISGDNASGSEAATSSMNAANVAGAAQGAVNLASQEASGDSTSDVAGGAVSGAATGAQVGGVKGAVVGGVIGGAMGLLKSSAAREKQQREIEAKKLLQLGQIENEKQARIASALQNMGNAIGHSLNLNSNTIRI